MATSKEEATSTSAPSFNAKDTTKSSHEKFETYSSDLRSYVNTSLARNCDIEGAEASITNFCWLLFPTDKQASMPSYPKLKAVPAQLSAPSSADAIKARKKKRHDVREYNVKIQRLRNTAQEKLWHALKRTFGKLHPTWFDELDPFQVVKRATATAEGLAADAAAALLAKAGEADKNHGTSMYLRLQKHYIDERPTGILARLLDLHSSENSFDGDWSKYENRMLSSWHVLHSSVAKYSIEELQVLKCLIGVINNIPDRSPLEHWRSWAQNYLLNHSSTPGAWTFDGFLAIGKDHAESHAVTSKSARSRATASHVKVSANNAFANKRGRQSSGKFVKRGSSRPCGNCGKHFVPKKSAHKMCDSCAQSGALETYVGSADGAHRLKGRIDKKRKAGFAKMKRNGFKGKNGSGDRHVTMQPAQGNVVNAAAGAPLPPPPQAMGNHVNMQPPGFLAQAMNAGRAVIPANGFAGMAYIHVESDHPRDVGVRTAFWTTHVSAMNATVRRAMTEQPFSIPRVLHQQVPEHFAILDSGASHHLVPWEAFLADAVPCHHTITWGNSDTSHALQIGRLIGTTITIRKSQVGHPCQASDLLFSSSTATSCMQAPDVHRPLASLVRLTREDGHEPRLADANPHLILRSSSADPLVIPLVFADNFWFLPLWPPPHTSAFGQSSPARVYQHFPNTDNGGEAHGALGEDFGLTATSDIADQANLRQDYMFERLADPSSEEIFDERTGRVLPYEPNYSAWLEGLDRDDQIGEDLAQEIQDDLPELVEQDEAEHDDMSSDSEDSDNPSEADEDANDDDDDDPPPPAAPSAAVPSGKRKISQKDLAIKLAKKENAKGSNAKHSRGKKLSVTEKRELRKALIEAHERYGHVDPSQLVVGRRHGRFHSSSIPSRGRLLWKVEDCPIYATMKQAKKRKPGRRPKALVEQDGEDWKPWDKVFADSSGKHRVAARDGSRYFTLFKCAVTGDRRYYSHKKKSHYTMVFLKLCASLGRWPKLLVSDAAGEVIKKTLKSWLLAKGTVIETIPRSEHHFTGSIEIEIRHLSNSVKCTMAHRNIPVDLWHIVGEYLTLVNSCIRSSPLDKQISCHEAATSELPDLDMLPPVGCMAIRNLDKIDRSDFKLSPANEAAVFIGLAHLGETFGSVLMTEKSLVVARDNVHYLKDYFPLTLQRPGHVDWQYLHRLLHYGEPSAGTNSEADATDEASCALESPAIDIQDDILADDDSDPDVIDAELDAVLTHMPKVVAVQPDEEPLAFQKADSEALRGITADIAAEDQGVARTRARRAATAPQPRPPSSSGTSSIKNDRPNKASFTLDHLKANKLIVLGRRLMRHFPDHGGAWGSIRSYDAQADAYHITYADGWEEDLPFEDLLRLLPKSWLAKAEKENLVKALWSLARAESVASAYASFSTPKPAATQVLTEPRSHIEAMHAPDRAEWIIAFDKEYHTLEGLGCFNVIQASQVPAHKSILRSKWVLKLKFKDGVFERRKARVVLCGYDMIQGVDYETGFSPTCSQVSLRLVLALTASPGWISYDYDAESAFISASLKPSEYLYMRPLPGYDIGAGNILEVRRNLYGSVEASRKFFLLAKHVYTTKAGLRQLHSDPCVFVRYEWNVKGEKGPVDNDSILKNGQFNSMPIIPKHERIHPDCPHAICALVILLYVDNTAIRTNAPHLKDAFLAAVAKDGRISLVLEGMLNWFLGVRFQYDYVTGAVTADQEAYINTLLHRHGMTDCKPESLPLPAKFDIYGLPVPERPDKLLITSYASLTGEMLYVSINTAPELSQPMHQLTRFMTKAGKAHLAAAKNVLKYLKKHRSRALRWCAQDVSVPYSPFTIIGFADSSWADDKLGRKSSMFYVLLVNGAAFSWKAQLSSIIATSTAEAELLSLGVAVQETMWARQLAHELSFTQLLPTSIYEDNHACIKMTHKELNRSRSKHMHLKYCFIHHHYSNGTFDAIAVASADQVADVGTALRPVPQFERCTRVMRGESA